MDEDIQKFNSSNAMAAVNLLRAVHRHYSQLSTIADFKANVVVGVTLIILANFAVRYELVMKLPSLIVLSFFLLVSLFFALITLIPKLSYYKKNTEVPKDYLFFQMFKNMSYEEFESVIINKISTEAGMIQTLLIEIYDLGMYLDYNKYRYIHLSYQMLLTGIVLSICTFVITHLIRFIM